MVLEQAKNNATILGDITENRVGIDTKNINFITQLLTTNLYSRPLASFFRETVSNAYDSHVEAGTLDKPIVIIIGADDNNSPFSRYWNTYNRNLYKISIRDFGTGISPERFEKIYRFIGSSTKRDSNDFIGAFGIGRFSCLSCADTATVSSYYNGKKYTYLMYKNDGGINIDRVSVVDTSYHNGIEVSIAVNTSMDTIYDALKELALFNNLEVQYLDGLCPPNYKESYDEYDNFWYNKKSYITDKQVAVGNVLYVVPDKFFSDDLKGTIVPKLQVGSVDVTPNRENLLFNKKTTDALSVAYSKSLEEIREIAKRSPIEVSTIAGFYKAWYSGRTVDSKGNTFYYEDDNDCRRFILNGKEISLDTPPNHMIMHYEFSMYSCAFLKGRKYSPKFISVSYPENYEIIIKESPRFKQSTKDYIKDKYPNSVIIDPKDIFSIKKSLIRNVGKKETKFIFKNTPIIKITNEDVPKEYSTPNKKERRVNTGIIKARMYLSDGRYTYCDLYPSDFKRKFHKDYLYIYVEHSRVEEALVYAQVREVRVCTFKADDLWIMESLPNAVYIDNIFDSCYGVLRKAATHRIIYDYYESKNLSISLLRNLQVYSEYTSGETVPKKLASIYFKRGWIKYGMLSDKIYSQNEIDAYTRIRSILSNGSRVIRNYILSHVGIYPQFGYYLKDYTDINKLMSTTV